MFARPVKKKKRISRRHGLWPWRQLNCHLEFTFSTFAWTGCWAQHRFQLKCERYSVGIYTLAIELLNITQLYNYCNVPTVDISSFWAQTGRDIGLRPGSGHPGVRIVRWTHSNWPMERRASQGSTSSAGSACLSQLLSEVMVLESHTNSDLITESQIIKN